jgi:signal transduction histidine kinase
MTYRAVSYLGQPAWQLMVHDTTALNRLRQQNRRRARLASLGELAADFTEQVRPSLATLAAGWRHLSQRLPLDPEEQGDFDLAIERIERIVDNVHDFSHVEEPCLSEHDLVQVLSTAVRPLREVFAINGVKIHQDFEHRHAKVQADRHQMLQVFTNVLENAHLAMADGGDILIETWNLPGTIEVMISDSGEGIASNRLERIFDPFYTTRKGGTGLGLAVVARILGRHGCWHAVESEPGQGTRFTFSFPLARLNTNP